MLPSYLWFILASSMLALGAFLGYGGLRVQQAGFQSAGLGLMVLGLVFLLWGGVVFARTVRRGQD